MDSTNNLSPQQTALMMSLMGGNQSSPGSMVAGGAGGQGMYAPNSAGNSAASALSKVMTGIAMQNMMKKHDATTQATQTSNMMLPSTNAAISNDPTMQGLQASPTLDAPITPVQSISPTQFSAADEDEDAML